MEIGQQSLAAAAVGARGGVYYSGFHVHLEVGFSTLSSAYFLCGHDSKQCDCAREEEAHMRTRTNPYQPFTAGKSAVLLGAGAGHVVYALSPSGLSNFWAGSIHSVVLSQNFQDSPLNRIFR